MAAAQIPSSQGLTSLAAVFRCYGIRIYLSVNFAAPILAEDLDTADPLKEDVQAWWPRKTDEVYDLIPGILAASS